MNAQTQRDKPSRKQHLCKVCDRVIIKGYEHNHKCLKPHELQAIKNYIRAYIDSQFTMYKV